MATVNGAKALKMQGEIGTLEKGKLADLVLINLERITREYFIHPSIRSFYLSGAAARQISTG